MLGFDDISEVWELYADRLLLILRPHGQLAEDGLQEAFLALAKQEQLPQAPLAWLVTVARNSILQCQRSENRRTKRLLHSDRISDWFHQTQLANSVENMAEAREASAALQALPREQAEIVMLHIWGELSFTDIAKLTASSRSTVHRNYQRALQELRNKLGTPVDLPAKLQGDTDAVQY